MTARRVDALALALLGVATLAGFVLWPALPASMAVHFDATGRPDDYLARPLAIVAGPAIGALAVAVTRLSGRFDDDANPVVLDATVAFVGVTIAVVQAFTLAWNLGYRVDVTLVVVPILLGAGLLVALALRATGTAWR